MWGSHQPLVDAIMMAPYLALSLCMMIIPCNFVSHFVLPGDSWRDIEFSSHKIHFYWRRSRICSYKYLLTAGYGVRATGLRLQQKCAVFLWYQGTYDKGKLVMCALWCVCVCTCRKYLLLIVYVCTFWSVLTPTNKLFDTRIILHTHAYMYMYIHACIDTHHGSYNKSIICIYLVSETHSGM